MRYSNDKNESAKKIVYINTLASSINNYLKLEGCMDKYNIADNIL